MVLTIAQRQQLFCALVLLLCGLPRLGWAQRSLMGTVVESGSSAAIPFAVVELPIWHVGTQADANGAFTLDLPAGLRPTDSLTISALGYRRSQVPVPASNPCVLPLVPAALLLQAVVVHATRAAPIRLGPGDKQNYNQYGWASQGLTPEKSTGWQVARFFPAPPEGLITSVSFYIKKRRLANCSKKLLQAPFRVRIYAADGPGGRPGTDLLQQSVLSAAQKPGWHTVDLARFHLSTQAAGLYVAMEWLYTADTYLCQYQQETAGTSKTGTGTTYGQVLGGILGETGNTWFLTAGQPWRKPTLRVSAGQPIAADAAIRLLVQP